MVRALAFPVTAATEHFDSSRVDSIEADIRIKAIESFQNPEPLWCGRVHRSMRVHFTESDFRGFTGEHIQSLFTPDIEIPANNGRRIVIMMRCENLVQLIFEDGKRHEIQAVTIDDLEFSSARERRLGEQRNLGGGNQKFTAGSPQGDGTGGGKRLVPNREHTGRMS